MQRMILIGRMLKRGRVMSGKRQKDIAEHMGVTGQTVCGWENGKQKIDILSLKKLCDYLEIDFIGLLTSVFGEGASAEDLTQNFALLNDENKKKVNEYIDFLLITERKDNDENR